MQIGTMKGETPRKETYFYKEDAPDSMESATPERADGPVPKGALKYFNSLSEADEEEEVDPYSSPPQDLRPTTSRGKSHPSPDEFFDYVVPSPEKDRGLPATTLVFDSPGKEMELARKTEPYNDSSSESVMSTESESSSGTDDDMDMDSVSVKGKELAAIGCWIFGSMLAV